ncbi:MAG: hypothetical protein JKY52_08415 [Flavobacteriales bacterium]|nr:hypothetical protein [Flavobacteriales bacterium]
MSDKEETARNEAKATSLTDDQCRHILMTIKKGYGGGFPMDPKTGEMISWYDWLRSTIRNDMLKNGGE